MKKILLIYGGPSGEHDVSLKSADMIGRHLDSSKYQVEKVLIHKDETWQFFPDSAKLKLGEAITKITQEHFDAAALITIHGAFGEDGKLQAILESIKIPYTGSGATASAIAMDKSVSNMLFASVGLPVPKFVTMKRNADNRPAMEALQMPVVVKPLRGGSSLGTSIVREEVRMGAALGEGFSHDEWVVVQEYIEGREFTCGVIEATTGEPFALPPTEIIPQDKSFFDYQAKYIPGASREITPPDLPAEQIQALQNLAVQAHRVLGCRGISRSDFILKDNLWYILETNTIPGMTETSLIPQEAKVAGIDFPSLLDILIESAFNK